MYIPFDLWFRAFVLTLVVEVPVAMWLLRDRGPGRPRLVALVVFANLVSHPVVWFVISQLADIGSAGYIALAEGWAITVEAVFFWVVLPGLPVRAAVTTSLAANAASFAAGRLVVAVWPALFW